MLSLLGVAAAAGTAAAKQIHPRDEPVAEVLSLDPTNVSRELRQALSRFEERFGT